MKVAGNLFLVGLFILAIGEFVVNFLRENGSNEYARFNFIIYLGVILMVIGAIIKLVKLFVHK